MWLNKKNTEDSEDSIGMMLDIIDYSKEKDGRSRYVNNYNIKGLKQCHKPPIRTENGNHTTYGDDWGMVKSFLFYPH